MPRNYRVVAEMTKKRLLRMPPSTAAIFNRFVRRAFMIAYDRAHSAAVLATLPSYPCAAILLFPLNMSIYIISFKNL
jgi:hypothetical protein